ncbi:MAG: hypothetical protein SF051_02845 [Elusimicrobiota bacterium]|nr:hypothetical protein [Elusimicrobiota bacterium]
MDAVLFWLSVPALYLAARRAGRRAAARAALAAGVALLALKAADLALGLLPSALPPDAATRERGLLSLELHPYDGWHLPARFTHRGPLPRESQPYDRFEVRTGPMGFLTDLDLDAPPPRAPGELRVVLTGGSGAQGWGASRNETMLYRRLEEKLSARLRRRVRVVNLAMAGSVAYQNFIALNRHAHALAPDLIVAYLGYNDFQRPFESGSDAFHRFPELAAYALAARGDESVPGLGWLQDRFPRLFAATGAGPALKLLLGRRRLVERARAAYERERGIAFASLPPREFVRRTAVEQTALALGSIGRDFPDASLLVAWQAVGPWEREAAAARGLPPDFYSRAFEEVRAALGPAPAGRRRFIDAHARFAREPRPGIGVHLSDEGQEAVAELLAAEAEPLLRGRR